MSGEKILIVDDDAVIVSLCEAMLRGEGYVVTGLTDSRQAVELARQEKFDVVVADYVMPGLDGVETFAAIKEVWPDTLGILITGYGTQEIAVAALHAGFSGFIDKPFTFQLLLETLDRALSNRRLAQENMRLQTLTSLYQAVQRLVAIHDQETLWQAIVDLAVTEGEADRASLMLVDPEGRELSIKAAHGLDPTAMAAMRKPLGEPIAGRVVADGEPMLINGGPQQNPDLAPWLWGHQDMASLCLPLRANGRALGVLNLTKQRPGAAFRPGDKELLSTLATQSALSIARLQLVEEQMQNARLATLGRMAAQVIHDLRAPMNQVVLVADRLRRTLPAVATEAQLILDGMQRLNRMCTDVLEFAQGQVTLRRRPCPLPTWIAQLTEACRSTFEKEGIQLLTEVEFTGQATLDPHQMERVLINLLDNARDATPAGGYVRLRVWKEGSQLVFQVADNGKGIPLEVQAHIFEPFFTHEKTRGVGLGLAIARTIVIQHGGTITVDSFPGEGTTFTVGLPLLD